MCVLWFSEMSTIKKIYCPFLTIVKVRGEGGGAEHYWTIETVVPPVLSEWGQGSRERMISQRRIKERPQSRALLFDLASTAKSKIIISHRTTKQA